MTGLSQSRLSQMNETADGSGPCSRCLVSLSVDPSLHRWVWSLRSVRWDRAPICGGRALRSPCAPGLSPGLGATPLSLAPVMDGLWGLMNRPLSAWDLIWDSDTKTEERRHHPTLCLKYSSHSGKEGCVGEFWEAGGILFIIICYLKVKLTPSF